MKQRFISAIILALIAIIAIILGSWTFYALVFIFAAIGLYEFYNAFSKKGYSPVKAYGIIFLAVLVLMVCFDGNSYMEIFIHTNKYGDINIFTPVFMLIILSLFSIVVIRHEKYTVADMSITVLGGLYVVLLISYFIKLRDMEGGLFLFLAALIGAVGTDTFALFVGKAIGKRPLIEAVSPKKTIEGSIGGFAGNIIVLSVFGAIVYYTGACTLLPIYQYSVIGAITGVTSQFGDLAASSMKRYVGIKDFGKLIPGHGGVLDRIDSYLFSIPVVYYYLLLLV